MVDVPASADIGYGTLFQTGADTSPETWTTLAQVNAITPPGISRDAIDVSHEQSPGEYREFIAGMKDAGEVSLELNFKGNSAGYQALLAEVALTGSSAVKPRRILFRDTSYLEFDAFVTGLEPDAPLDDKMSLAVTFKVTGQPLLTVPA